DFVKVMDFGIALLQNPPTESLRITAADMTVGTPLYLSPEQAAGDVTDKRSDIYSLGIVFYELLAGSPPFNGDNYKEVMISHLIHRPVPIHDQVPVCEWVSDLVMKMLVKNPSRRPQTVEEILALIDKNLNAEGSKVEGSKVEGLSSNSN